MAQDPYRRLIGTPGGGDPFDRHLFACAIAVALADSERPLAGGLGLSSESLAALIGRHFPACPELLTGLAVDGGGDAPDAPEEPDLRALLLDHRHGALVEEEWLAHIVARRALGPNHLWQDLGLSGRGDLSALFLRHFPTLAALNAGDMKWKKFLYRELCRRDGISVCKAPTCDVCVDYPLCFGSEEGASPTGAAVLSRIRQTGQPT